MSSPLPLWADPQLSAALPTICARGEGPDAEFKKQFPEQAHPLAENIAAFATSGGGRIFLGIEDDGTTYDLNAKDGSERDELIRRAQGIVRAVRPDVQANYRLAIDQGKTVLCIDIPKQQEPLYYYDGRPYVRDGSTARRATPDEVKELVWKHPSSEHKRFEEKIKQQQLQAIADMGSGYGRHPYGQ